MDLDPQYTSNKSHSGNWHDDEECRDQNAAKYQVKHKRKHKGLAEDSLKLSLINNSGQEDWSDFDVGVSNNEICEENGDVISTESCFGDSTQKTTRRRPTLRELLQLPEDYSESPSELISESKVFKHSGHQGQKVLEMKYKWCRLLKSRGIFWSSLLKLQCRGKEEDTKMEEGSFHFTVKR